MDLRAGFRVLDGCVSMLAGFRLDALALAGSRDREREVLIKVVSLLPDSLSPTS